jgi:hypothetical protein
MPKGYIAAGNASKFCSQFDYFEAAGDKARRLPRITQERF